MANAHKPLSNDNFLLAPAILVPFHGIPGDRPRPKDREGKLRRILEDLEKHHDSVRRNMIYLVSLQREKLLSDAKEALERDRGSNESLYSGLRRESLDPELQRDVKEVLESLKEPARRGTNGKEYEYEEGDLTFLETRDAQGALDTDGDSVMGGMGGIAHPKVNIPWELTSCLQELVLRAASEIASYDKHAEATRDYYQRALQRNAAREGTGTDTAASAGTGGMETFAPARDRIVGGILKNKNEEIRIDTEALARMAKEEQSPTFSEQVRSAIDSSRDPRRSSVNVPKGVRKNSVEFAKDLMRPSQELSKDVWRR